jgi:hypothetical protein
MSTLFLGIIAVSIAWLAFRISLWLNDNPIIWRIEGKSTCELDNERLRAEIETLQRMRHASLKGEKS